jgi:DNA polymerase-1
MRLVFDLEADGLLRADNGKPEITKVHCLVTKDLDTGEVARYFDDYGAVPFEEDDGSLEEGVHALQEAETIIPHNGIGYDIPVISRFFGVELYDPKKVRDTCVMSRLMFPRIGDLDGKRDDFPRELFGRHSLEAWGYRLGEAKGAYGQQEGAFETLTPEMLDYCEQDVEVTAKLYELLSSKPWPERSIELEHRFAHEISLMMDNGFPFDIEAARDLEVKLEEELSAIDARLHKALGPRVIEMKTKTKIEPVNLGSSMQVVAKLKELFEWEPSKYTPSGRAQFDGDIIAALPDSMPVKADLLARDTLIGARKRLLGDEKKQSGLIQRAQQRDDGSWWIHHFCNHNGARTGRCTHSFPNVNFPRVTSPWGPEFRGMVKAPEGWTIVGCDMSGVDARAIAHYLAPLDGGAMVSMILEGNLHDVNRDLMAEVVPEITRSIGKNVFYAVCYGAYSKRVGLTAKAPKKGKALRKLIRERVTGLEELIEGRLMSDGTRKGGIKKKVEEQGWIRGLDGRRLRPDAPFSALNTLSQGAAAVLMKEATSLAMTRIRAAGIEAYLILHVHDEGQVLCRPKDAVFVGETWVQSIIDAGEIWELRCPLDAEWKQGSTWAETH